MSVKVIIVRRVPADKLNELEPLLLEMRALALAQRGYISGETLINADDQEEHMVISSWTSRNRWNEWRQNPKRLKLQKKIDKLLNQETLYTVYRNE